MRPRTSETSFAPSAFNLGEAHKIVILSVTKGDDKPLEHPDRFHASDLMPPYIDFDTDACFRYVRRLNPGIETPSPSARDGEEPDRRMKGTVAKYAFETIARVMDEEADGGTLFPEGSR